MPFEMHAIIMPEVLGLARHAVARFAQRGFRDGDVECIVANGTEVEGRYFFRKMDALSREDHRMSRLVGKRVVMKCDTVVTVNHVGKGKECWLLRNY